jgi:hypothetical protein
MADLPSIKNSDLFALAGRLRDGADNMLADRSLADDLRAAADLASRWANFREGWPNPDLSYLAIHELSERLCDYAETGAAVLASDVYLAACCVDMLCSWISALRQIPNAPENVDVRQFVQTVFLIPVGAEALTVEEIASFRKPATEG